MVRFGALLAQRELHKCAEFAFAAAVALDGDCREARCCLAETHFALGAVWKAIAQYEAVLLADPQDAGSLQRLGDCYQQLGVDEAAQLAHSRSRDLGSP